jgi:hypothetical protein
MSAAALPLSPSSAQLIKVMQRHPVGHQFRSREIVGLAGIRHAQFQSASKPLILLRLMKQDKLAPKLSLWSLTQAGADVDVSHVQQTTSIARPPRQPQRREMAEVPPPIVHGSLRDLLASSEEATTGDPLRGLVEAMDAARQVLAAKRSSRFKGAEVDLLVARELRQIAEAAERAKVNLLQALEVMG